MISLFGKLLLFISTIKSNKWDAFFIIFAMFDVKGAQMLSVNRDKLSTANMASGS